MGGMLAEKLAEKYNINSYATEEEQLEFWQRILKKHPQIKLESLKDAPRIPSRIISKTIENIVLESTKKKNKQLWENKVAPSDLIDKDIINTTQKTSTLFINSEMRHAFSIRASPGHAAEGAGQYCTIINGERLGIEYPNTTTQDILKSQQYLSRNEIEMKITRKKNRRQRRAEKLKKKSKAKKVKTPKPTKADRRKITTRDFQLRAQKGNDNIIHQMERWLYDMISNPSKILSTTKVKKLKTGGRPLNEMCFFKSTEIDMLELMRGFYLAANMDDFKEVRKYGHEKYGHQTGGGECFLGKTDTLKDYNIGLKDMAKIQYKGALKILNYFPHETRIKILKDLDTIETKTLPLEEIAAGEFTWNKIKQHPSTTNLTKNPNYWPQYLRDTLGDGVGDDMVIFLAGFIAPSIYEKNHKESKYAVQSRILGALLADQMDTVEKDSAFFIPGGQDKIGALHINGLFNKLCNLKVYNSKKEEHRDYGKAFRKRFGIKKRADNKYDLIPHNEIVDYTMAGANTKDQHIHSSQRWFYMEKEDTCAIKEYMKYAISTAKYQLREIYESDLKGFNIENDKNNMKEKFTFREIPLETILATMKERLELISEPRERESKLKTFYSKAS